MITNKPVTYNITLIDNNYCHEDVRIASCSKDSAINTTLELFPNTKIVSIRICEQW